MIHGGIWNTQRSNKYLVDKSLDIGFLPKDVTQFAGSLWIWTQLHGCQSFCVTEVDSFVLSSSLVTQTMYPQLMCAQARPAKVRNGWYHAKVSAQYLTRRLTYFFPNHSLQINRATGKAWVRGRNLSASTLYLREREAGPEPLAWPSVSSRNKLILQ